MFVFPAVFIVLVVHKNRCSDFNSEVLGADTMEGSVDAETGVTVDLPMKMTIA